MRQLLLTIVLIASFAPVMAQQYSNRDIDAIVDAAQHNDLRFDRDYKDKSFVGVLRFRSLDSYSWLLGGYMVHFYGAFCTVDEATAKSMIDWRAGSPASVSATIKGDTSFTETFLCLPTDCHVTAR